MKNSERLSTGEGRFVMKIGRYVSSVEDKQGNFPMWKGVSVKDISVQRYIYWIAKYCFEKITSHY